MRIALVLSGGNALGAYGAGAYEALHARGYRVDLISGASIGAINGAIIAGNAFEHRIDRLREFWAQAGMGSSDAFAAAPFASRRLRNLGNVVQTLLVGRPGLFVPRIAALALTPPIAGAASWMADLANARASVFDHRPGVATLRRVIDFDRLNEAKVPLIVTAIEAQSGRQVRFDARTHRLAPEHLLATTAMPPLFPPIEIEGRSLADPGLVENLPLDPVLDPPLDTDLVCLAVDAYAPNGEALHDLDTAAERAQDIVFASQSWRALRGHLERHRLRRIVGSLLETRDRGDDRARAPEAARREASAAQLTVVRIAYRAPAYEVAGKALDYSRWSLAERWSAGHDDMQRALTRLETETGACRGDGYALYDCGNDRTDSPVVR